MRRSRPAALERTVFGLAALLLLVLAFVLGQKLLERRGTTAETLAPGGRTSSVTSLPPGATGTESAVSVLAPLRGEGSVRPTRRSSGAPPPPAK